jgi:hypothetical protein
MLSLSATTSVRIRRLTSLIVAAFAVAALLAMVAPAARMPSSGADSSMAQYGWGAAATFAKQQTRTAIATSANNDFLAQYGWGAAATFAKQHA